ncbi:MAG: nuclear transport factor 2 family protein [Deltaproteobacteria bacterium]|nr:nuclear transport factor 2 family protein [Deltaproteobacteria bacterium]
MPIDAEDFLVSWNRAVHARNTEGLAALLADEVSMGAPPYWNRIEGKAVVAQLLGIIVETIADFTYHRQWVNGAELALEFEGHVGDCALQGIDLITLGEDGLITRLDVMIRPENALVLLRERVGPRMVEFFETAGD